MRKPVVAGTFYPAGPDELRRAIEDLFTHPLGPGSLPKGPSGARRVLGGVVPHAGYIYSGPVAAHTYKAIAEDRIPETFVVIGPNHTGLGARISVCPMGYDSPLGPAELDEELARAIVGDSAVFDLDAHIYEHSIEVQIPFIKYLFPRARVVPIVMMDQSLNASRILGRRIREAVAEVGRDAVILASSDFSHYVPREAAYSWDGRAIKALEGGDIEEFYRLTSSGRVSACGYGPIIAAYCATGGRARLLKYATSGEVEPMPRVVGYASIVFER